MPAPADEESIRLPVRSQFPVVEKQICLNNARWHPMSLGARRAAEEYYDYKAEGSGLSPDRGSSVQEETKNLFAKLINAKPAEISFVPSTTVGENLVASGLGLPQSGGNVVTDALHFEGSLYQYGEMAKQGLDVRVIRPTEDWRIDLGDLEKVIDKNTRLVALSLVSMINGFQPDLKAVCDLAHAHGAHVYADVIQAAGAIPIDVRASGIDFCACSAYKWLMGDMGIGFLYVREDLLDGGIKRSQYGFRQLTDLAYHVFPYDPPGSQVMDWTAGTDAGAHFEVGTVANATLACLTHSLKFFEQVGVANIQAYRQPMIDRLQKELPGLGFEPMTPPGTTSPIVSFAVKDPKPYVDRLRQAKVNIAIYPHRIRISPSVYNDDSDITRLLECLS